MGRGQDPDVYDGDDRAFTVEEHSVLGGLGGAVAEVVAEQGLRARVVRHGLRDEYALIGPPTHLYRHYRLDAEGIARAARAAVR
ncbi:transketolase C-terminal domain-containing protein [Amycolatopsis methanolica]|uniref:transketolase C-terminal domain-containing protein n=1 Tax=Amycolatopsis methanolica TaxID=1814 RepID=UPI001CC25ECD